jgi:hypothetical protein
VPPRVGLPIQEVIRDLLQDLFDRGIAIDKTTSGIDDEHLGATVSYRDDDGQVAVVVVLDKAAVAHLGAALVMVPLPAVEDALKGPTLPENFYENFYEVANVMMGLFNKPTGGVHVVLADRIDAGTDLPDDVRAGIDGAQKSRTFDVTIVGYGSGRMALYAV